MGELESRAYENRPLNNRPLDSRPLDNRPLDNRPLDNRPLDISPIDNRPLDNRTFDQAIRDRAAYNRDTMLQSDIQRISEKIDHMGISRAESRLAAQREIEIRRENEKVIQEEFANKRMDNTYRLTESDYSRPLIPHRSPLRSPPGSAPQTPEYPGSPNVVPVNSPNGYHVASPHVFSGEEKDGWR
jgi:hypothetical protein